LVLLGMMTAGVVSLTVAAGFALTFLTNRQVIVLPVGITPRCLCWSAGGGPMAGLDGRAKKHEMERERGKSE
jgi:hypothetical protein